MSFRPNIPLSVKHEVLSKAGYRCPICLVPLLLERAHIVPLERTRDRSAENLICLCASCHDIVHNQLGVETLRAYKALNEEVVERSLSLQAIKSIDDADVFRWDELNFDVIESVRWVLLDANSY